MFFPSLVLSYYKKDENKKETTFLEFPVTFNNKLNAILLIPVIETFWKEVINLSKTNYTSILISFIEDPSDKNCKPKFLHKGILVHKDNMDVYINYVLSHLIFSYHIGNVYKVINFKYFKVDNNKVNGLSRRFLKLERPSPKVLKEFKTELFPNLNFPINNFYLKWGYILNSKNSQLQIKNVNHIITITKVSTYVNEIVFRDINTDEILVSFKDISLNNNLFIREINRALPDSNWDHPNRQSGTLPIKLRALD